MSKDYFGDLEEDIDSEKVEKQNKRDSLHLANYEGHSFGQWLVLKKISNIKYLCRCSCGIEEEKSIYNLKGRSRQCMNCYRSSKVYWSFRRF